MSSKDESATIDIDRLSFAYNGNRVLHDVSLRLAPGEMVAVIGPNGAGKTTLMACVNGLLPDHQGLVQIGGCDVRCMRPRNVAQIIGVVPQEFRIPFAYRVREIVSLGRSPYLGRFGVLTDADERVVDRALAATDIEALQGREYNALSGGERQRVVIALALAQEPRVLLLDEPTAHLDLSHRVQLLRLVGAINAKRGVTVLAALHDIDLAATGFRRVIVLSGGRVVADGPPREVITPGLLRQVFGVDAQIIEDPLTGAPRVLPNVETSFNSG
jgi:iron complex transport system ATP-binding protein